MELLHPAHLPPPNLRKWQNNNPELFEMFKENKL